MSQLGNLLRRLVSRTNEFWRAFSSHRHVELITISFHVPPADKGLPMRWMRAEPTVRRKGKHTFATAVKNAQQLIWEEIIQQIFTDYVTQNTLVLEDAGVDVLPWDGPIGIHTIGRYLRPKSATDWRDPLIPPDIDNVWKLVSDALEKVAYRNDQQIVQGGMKKIEVSDKPGTLIAITFYAKATKPTFNFRF